MHVCSTVLIYFHSQCADPEPVSTACGGPDYRCRFRTARETGVIFRKTRRRGNWVYCETDDVFVRPTNTRKL